MDPELAKELQKYIVQELLRSRHRDEIITEVCQRANILWVEGEYLLERTERENKVLLRQEKSPIRMFISILAMAVGLVWMAISLIRLLAPYASYRMAADQSLQGYAWPAESAGLVIQAVVGLGMLVTGLVLTIQQLKVIRRRG
jgi:hypothetical protein